MDKVISLQRGLSLAEVLVGTFIFATLSTAILSLATLGTRTAIVNEQRTVAQGIASEKAEFIRAIPYPQVGYTDANPCGIDPKCEPDGVVLRQEKIVRNAGQEYTVDVLIEVVDDPINGEVAEQLTESNADFKKVIVNVTGPSAALGAAKSVSSQMGLVVVPQTDKCAVAGDCGSGQACCDTYCQEACPGEDPCACPPPTASPTADPTATVTDDPWPYNCPDVFPSPVTVPGCGDGDLDTLTEVCDEGTCSVSGDLYCNQCVECLPCVPPPTFSPTPTPLSSHSCPDYIPSPVTPGCGDGEVTGLEACDFNTCNTGQSCVNCEYCYTCHWDPLCDLVYPKPPECFSPTPTLPPPTNTPDPSCPPGTEDCGGFCYGIECPNDFSACFGDVGISITWNLPPAGSCGASLCSPYLSYYSCSSPSPTPSGSVNPSSDPSPTPSGSPGTSPSPSGTSAYSVSWTPSEVIWDPALTPDTVLDIDVYGDLGGVPVSVTFSEKPEEWLSTLSEDFTTMTDTTRYITINWDWSWGPYDVTVTLSHPNYPPASATIHIPFQ